MDPSHPLNLRRAPLLSQYQEVTDPKESGELGRLCGRAARAENFDGHARSGDLRAALTLGDQHGWIYEH
jgi:hypothetical protein